MKIFGIGLIRTGTTTLGQVLQHLGFNHCEGWYQLVNQLSSSYISGNLEPIFELIEKHDSFDDFPFCATDMFKILDSKYSDSKFVLTIREETSWFNSLSKYFNPPTQEPANLLEISQRGSQLPLGRFYGLVNFILATFGTLEIERNRSHFIKTYRKYNSSVINYFEDKPGKLLVVDWPGGDRWERICSFLDKPIPSGVVFPHANPS